jgi:hypothetical protein
LAAYNELVIRFGIQKEEVEKSVWENDVIPLSKRVLEFSASGKSSKPSVEEFLAWSLDTVDCVITPTARGVGNTRRFEVGGKVVSIQFGSIHSVKGETHTATLVLESYRFTHNMAFIAPWFMGKNFGKGLKSSDQELNRLKLHYVAMTRPSHLICLGLHKATFLKKSKKDLPKTIAALEGRGWVVKEV